MQQIEAALGKLERKLRQKKIESVLSCGDGGGSSADRSRHALYGGPSLHQGTNDLSIIKSSREERPSPSGSLVNSPFSYEQGVLSLPLNAQVFSNTGGAHFTNIYSKPVNTCSKEALIHSDQDPGMTNSLASEEKENSAEDSRRKLHSRRKSYNCEKHHIPRGLRNDEGKSHSNYRWLERVFSRRSKTNKRISVFLCSFCKICFLYKESYQKHMSKCLTCPQCSIKFCDVSQLHKHVTVKAHTRGCSFLKPSRMTLSQLRSRISRNEVLKSDLKKMKMLSYTNSKKSHT